MRTERIPSDENLLKILKGISDNQKFQELLSEFNEKVEEGIIEISESEMVWESRLRIFKFEEKGKESPMKEKISIVLSTNHFLDRTLLIFDLLDIINITRGFVGSEDKLISNEEKNFFLSL